MKTDVAHQTNDPEQNSLKRKLYKQLRGSTCKEQQTQNKVTQYCHNMSCFDMFNRKDIPLAPCLCLSRES